MSNVQPTSRRRLLGQLLIGLAYLALVAAMLRSTTGHSFLVVLPAVIGGALFCSGLALAWLTLWAVRNDGRLGQFGLGSLFFLTVFAALYFGLVRWLVVAVERGSAARTGDGGRFLSTAVLCLVVVLTSVPFVLGMTESLLWLAVWIVRRRPVRKLLARKRRRLR
ncbi:MAG: hypothetical protein JXB62_09955 [Pirellulales bacterium]|nr:hypothetical protein [Pirellulales bacterium]